MVAAVQYKAESWAAGHLSGLWADERAYWAAKKDLTESELIAFLKDCDSDAPIVLGYASCDSWIGKMGTFGHRMTELACRLLSLHLRRDTPIEEIIEQCRSIKDMAPTPNVQEDGSVMWNTGVGDAISQVL